jgi:hypothetical protein
LGVTASYFFPVLFLRPDFAEAVIDVPPVRVLRRLWDTSIFNFATLGTRHRMRIPYQVMDVFLSRCNMEICVTGEYSLQEAIDFFQSLRLALYIAGVSPFLSPYVASHSINDYSGINSRDSVMLRDALPEGLQEGFTSEQGQIDIWPNELSFQCIVLPEQLSLTTQAIDSAVHTVRKWRRILSQKSSLKVIQDVVNTAPTIGIRDQSLLHIWSALESLFPEVNVELSFRIALYLAQLITNGPTRSSYFRKVKESYNLRSRITHGSSRDISLDDWKQTWTILIEACEALVRRGLPVSEQELLSELLS